MKSQHAEQVHDLGIESPIKEPSVKENISSASRSQAPPGNASLEALPPIPNSALLVSRSSQNQS